MKLSLDIQHMKSTHHDSPCDEWYSSAFSDRPMFDPFCQIARVWRFNCNQLYFYYKKGVLSFMYLTQNLQTIYESDPPMVSLKHLVKD